MIFYTINNFLCFVGFRLLVSVYKGYRYFTVKGKIFRRPILPKAKQEEPAPEERNKATAES